MASTAQDAPARIWLHGPLLDALFGCGGAYLLLLGLLVATGDSVRLAQPTLLFPLLTVLISGPHYGATLLRVYERRADRRAYALFSVWASAAVLALFVASLWNVALGSFLVTLYLTWSPWHYTGQNYGIAVMFLRRAGAPLDAVTKRWLYASFVSSFVFYAVVMRLDTGAGASAPGAGPGFRAIGIPASLGDPAAVVAGLVYLVASAVAGRRLARGRSLGALAPVALLSCSQMFWFVLPMAVRWSSASLGIDAFDSTLRNHYFIWIAAAHATQYLWVTSFFARRSGSDQMNTRWFLKALASGSAIWMIPALAFSPAMGGPLSMDAGLALLVASAVNVHHFILDGAIWKLRGRIADLLIRDVGADRAPAGGTLLRRAVWVACGLAVAAQVFQLVNVDRVRFAAELERRISALDRLSWLGLDSAGHRFRFGSAYLRRGEGEAAVEQLERASALSEAPRTWGALGLARMKTGDSVGALEALDRAVALSPENPDFHRARANALRELGRPAEAAAALDRAAELAPRGPTRRVGP